MKIYLKLKTFRQKFGTINKQGDYVITEIIPIEEAKGNKYGRIRELRPGRYIDVVIDAYNKRKQKSNTMYINNVENGKTTNNDDRLYNREQRKQINDERGQFIEESTTTREGVDNTVFCHQIKS